MARAASTVCSLCEGVGTQRGMDRDGNGGWKHKPGECRAQKAAPAAPAPAAPAPAAPAPAAPADLEAGHAERLAAAGLSTGLRADAKAKASPPASKPREDKSAGARGAAHRIAVLDFLRPKSAGLSFSPGEIARGSGENQRTTVSFVSWTTRRGLALRGIGRRGRTWRRMVCGHGKMPAR